MKTEPRPQKFKKDDCLRVLLRITLTKSLMFLNKNKHMKEVGVEMRYFLQDAQSMYVYGAQRSLVLDRGLIGTVYSCAQTNYSGPSLSE